MRLWVTPKVHKFLEPKSVEAAAKRRALCLESPDETPEIRLAGGPLVHAEAHENPALMQDSLLCLKDADKCPRKHLHHVRRPGARTRHRVCPVAVYLADKPVERLVVKSHVGDDAPG